MRLVVLLALAGCGRLGFDAPPDGAMIDGAPDVLDASCFRDNFDASDPRWSVLDAQSPFPATVQNSRFQIALSPGAAAYNGIRMTSPIVVSGASAVVVELVQAVDQGGFVDCELVVTTEAGARYDIAVGGGNIVYRIFPDQQLAPYDPVAHRYLRIAHDAGTLRWETSTNRTDWITRRMATVAPPAEIAAQLVAGAYAVGSQNPGTAIFDTFAVTTPSCP